MISRYAGFYPANLYQILEPFLYFYPSIPEFSGEPFHDFQKHIFEISSFASRDSFYATQQLQYDTSLGCGFSIGGLFLFSYQLLFGNISVILRERHQENL